MSTRRVDLLSNPWQTDSVFSLRENRRFAPPDIFPHQGEIWSDRLQTSKKRLSGTLQDLFTRELIRGDITREEMYDKVRRKFDAPMAAAKTLINTIARKEVRRLEEPTFAVGKSAEMVSRVQS